MLNAILISLLSRIRVVSSQEHPLQVSSSRSILLDQKEKCENSCRDIYTMKNDKTENKEIVPESVRNSYTTLTT